MGFLGGTYQGAAGVADVSCATEGADLSDPDANVVESGPKTFIVSASDAAGNTATRTVSIEIIEDTDSAGSWHKGDTLRPGHIYRHWPLFVEIPEGARISYGGSVSVTPEPGAPQDLPTQLQSFYAFRDPSRATILLIVSGTGEEAPSPLGRRVCRVNEGGGITSCDFRAPLTDAENEMWDRFLANIRTTPFPEGDPRNEPPAPLPPNPEGGQFSGSPPMCLSRGRVLMAIEPGRWLPYGDVPANPLNLHAPNPLNLHGIPCDTPVGVHPSLLVGDAISVCVEGGARDGLLVPAIMTAAGDWNDLLAPDHADPDPSERKGLGYAPFAFDTASPAGPAGLEDTDTSYVRVFDTRACHANNAAKCAASAGWTGTALPNVIGEPPRVTGNVLTVLSITRRRCRI